MSGETIDNEDEVDAFDTLRSRWAAVRGPALGPSNGLRVSRADTLPEGRPTPDPDCVSILRREEYMGSTVGQALPGGLRNEWMCRI